MPKVVLVGCGNMGHAMLKGWLRSGRLKPEEILVVEPADMLREKAITLGALALADANGITDTAPSLWIVFAIKPHAIEIVVPHYVRFKSDAIYVSLAAGTPIATFERLLGKDAAIVRCMPNTPVSIGEGMMVTVANRNVGTTAAPLIRELLASGGKVVEITDETLMDAVTAISGSGPAYLFHFVECLAAAAAGMGLPADTAKLLALQTVYGAAALANTSTGEIGELRRQVTSPNGTTAAALSVLMTDGRLQKLIAEATEAARSRSIELAREE
ncbi:pyrroline-5-carboxylate reductase [Mesorhizobium loti]|nr:pyrroline-5-carboxylate reductase [Mesorhizobium loti]PLP56680.1 pyrroline-5-carboxylate reductase [Mesorhizobium loti]